MEPVRGLPVQARLLLRWGQLVRAAAGLALSLVVAGTLMGYTVRAGPLAGRVHPGQVRVAVEGAGVPQSEQLVLSQEADASWGT